MKKKGFTLIELLAVLVIFGIISTVAVVSYSSYIKKTQITSYEKAEITMKGATESFFTYCMTDTLPNSSCKTIPNVGSSVTIDLTTLTDYGFMKEVIDQNNNSLCSGKVRLSNLASTSDNYNLKYEVCLKCSDYESNGCWY